MLQVGGVRGRVVHGSCARCPPTDFIQAFLVMGPEFGLRDVGSQSKREIHVGKCSFPSKPHKNLHCEVVTSGVCSGE